MGKPGFLSFFVVLAEISSGVNKFFWNDWGMMRMVSRKRRWVQRDAGSRRPFLQGIFERECRLPPSLRTSPPRDFESSGLVEAEEPPLPEVSDLCPRKVDCSASKRPSPDALRPCGLHTTPQVGAQARSRPITIDPQPLPVRSELETRGYWCIIFREAKFKSGIPGRDVRCGPRAVGG